MDGVVARIERFVSSGGAAAEGSFEELALAAFEAQVEHVAPYRRLCEARGALPGRVASWRDVPAVPTSAFKTVELAAAPAREVFRSSGTSQGEERRSVHRHPYPDLYRRVIDASFPRFCLPHLGGGPVPMLSLVPSREQMPNSSLSFMIDHVLERFGAPGSTRVFGKSRVELPAARSWLGGRQRSGQPGVILATAFALVQLLDGLDRMGLRFRLPVGSVLFETGGYKGRTQELSRADLLARVEERLGIPPSAVVAEYGMTELTSQCYGDVLVDPRPGREPAEPPRLVAPPWVRGRVLDPETLQEVEDGGTGLVAIFDLANVGSALHVWTEDLGRRDGEAFRLLGRTQGAELRGCSLTVEELERG